MERFNIKRLVLVLLAVMLISYSIGAAILFASQKPVFSSEKSNLNIDDVKTANIDGIKEIKITVSSTGINVIPTSDSEFKAHLNGNVMSTSPYTKPDLECYASGSTLYVNVKNNTKVTFGVFTSSLKLVIYIPSSYTNELQLSSSSGSMQVKDLKLNSLQCSASSGSTTIENVTADNFNYSSSSGSLTANGLTTKNSKLSSSSGSKRISGFTGNLNSTSSSGTTRVEYSSFDNDITISASSGSVEVNLPETAAFYLDASASSGSIRSDFPVTVTGSSVKHQLKGVVGNDKNKVKISTSSGSIRITK
jgi:lia operon protein LiaG